MISNPERTVLISSIGWVDKDALWRFDVSSGIADLIPLNSGAQYLSIHSSGSNYFSVCHHFRGLQFDVTVHSFIDPMKVLAQATVTNGETRVFGDALLWNEVPLLYVEYLNFEPWNDFALLNIFPESEQIKLQRLEWYDNTYDKGYQGVIGVHALSNQNIALIAVQRSSKLILHDLATGRQSGIVELVGRGGNPAIKFRGNGNEVWVSDYDTIVVLNQNGLQVIRSALLQGASNGTQEFIGDYSFSPDEKLCVVARPFSGDVIGIDTETLKIKKSAKVGRQPLEVVMLPRGDVVARDWKSGEILRGRLDRRWFGG